MMDRQEFAFEAAVRMRDRFLQQEVWDRMGVPVKDALELVMADEGRKMFQNILFSKIVPNCKKLGLLDRNQGWLRQRFTELGVIQFEDWVDTGEEYAMLDEVAKDREAAAGSLKTPVIGHGQGRHVRLGVGGRLRRGRERSARTAVRLVVER